MEARVLVCLLGYLAAQTVPPVQQSCPANQECRKDCPDYLRAKEMVAGSTERRSLVSELKEKICNKAAKGMCCGGPPTTTTTTTTSPPRQSGERGGQQCARDQECRREDQCPAFSRIKEGMKALEKGSAEYKNLVTKLRDRVCNFSQKSVCCDQATELTGGNQVTDVQKLPFMAYIRVRKGPGRNVECGASLITMSFLVSSRHCILDFDQSCFNDGQCFASFRDLNKKVFEPGEFKIDIFDVIEGPGVSDLALVKLLKPVNTHEDYAAGPPLQTVQLATEAPQVGEQVLTAGWGRTGFDTVNNRANDLSDQLRSLELTVKAVTAKYVITEVMDVYGKVTDTCVGKPSMQQF